jgi:6-phosphofructokinase 1
LPRACAPLFNVEGPNGLLEHVIKRLKSKKHALIVVAEGADDAALDIDLKKGGKKDAGGHVKHGDIGTFLKKRIVEYGKEEHGMEITLKYIDPTYAIRSVKANAGDTVRCTKLAQNAAHASMAGYTGFSIGQVRNTDAIIPIKCINKAGQSKISIREREWQRLLASTGQPQMINDECLEDARQKVEDEIDQKELRHQELINDQIEMSEIVMEAMETEDIIEEDPEI